ncbi:hypothetical protein PVW53_21570 [Seohaeicola sp. SP36]|uniref:hypothetical protein n=1 Tax=Seohaeicola sp. 4SK31 TaxID=3028386 RepID=UPI00237C1CFA|nr:hypothetical protein [Seohaeicola sp. 4SK31]MDD9709830.1 hypothetical protein [Seohaeicola sp. 4SK31]MDD9738089.1 hypothetical protein [Seohaeicola sp. SP36]
MMFAMAVQVDTQPAAVPADHVLGQMVAVVIALAIDINAAGQRRDSSRGLQARILKRTEGNPRRIANVVMGCFSA